MKRMKINWLSLENQMSEVLSSGSINDEECRVLCSLLLGSATGRGYPILVEDEEFDLLTTRYPHLDLGK